MSNASVQPFPTPTKARSRLALASSPRKKTPPEKLAELRQELAAANIAAAIDRALAAAPPLSDDQAERLAQLLRGEDPR